MEFFILYKERSAPQDQWRIHSRIKKHRNRFHLKKAEQLRKILGSKYVVRTDNPYGNTYKHKGKVKYLEKLPLEKMGLLGRLPSYQRYHNSKTKAE